MRPLTEICSDHVKKDQNILILKFIICNLTTGKLLALDLNKENFLPALLPFIGIDAKPVLGRLDINGPLIDKLLLYAYVPVPASDVAWSKYLLKKLPVKSRLLFTTCCSQWLIDSPWEIWLYFERIHQIFHHWFMLSRRSALKRTTEKMIQCCHQWLMEKVKRSTTIYRNILCYSDFLLLGFPFFMAKIWKVNSVYIK